MSQGTQSASKYPEVCGSNGFAVTPSNVTPLPRITNKLFVGTAGNLAVVLNEQKSSTGPTTFDPANTGADAQLQTGNLQLNSLSLGLGGASRDLDALATGKWYAEFTLLAVSVNGGGSPACCVGIVDGTYVTNNNPIGHTTSGKTVGISNNTTDTGFVVSWGNSTALFTGSHILVATDVVGVALDVDGNTVEFFINGASVGLVDLTTIAGYSGTTWYLAAFAGTEGPPNTEILANFGATSFAHAAPAGFEIIEHTTPATPLVLKNIANGTLLDLAVAYVMATGTTAQDLVGIT